MLTIVRDGALWRAAVQDVAERSVVMAFDYMVAGAELEQVGRAELAIWEGDDHVVVHPYVRRRIPEGDGFDDITSVFEFGGSWYKGTRPSSASLGAFGQAFASYCAKQGIVSEFVRVHPFADLDILRASGYEVEAVAEHTLVALDQPYPAIQAGYRHSLRKAIGKAERNGVRVERSEDFGPFIRIYHQNLERLGAQRYYYFPRCFFEQTSRYFELYYAFDASGEICAGHVYLRDGATIFAFLCHGVPESLHLRPNDCIYDFVIRKEAGGTAQYLHLGGGHPSLIRYKRRFSQEQISFSVARRIHDPRVYERLTLARERELGASLASSRYFPRYRASIPRDDEQPTLARTNLPTSEERDAT